MLSAGTSLWRVTRQRFQDGGNSEVSGLSFVGESCDTIYCTCRPILIALPSTIPETNLRIVQYLSSWLGCIQKSTLLMAPFWRISASASGNLSKTTTKTTGIKVNLCTEILEAPQTYQKSCDRQVGCCCWCVPSPTSTIRYSEFYRGFRGEAASGSLGKPSRTKTTSTLGRGGCANSKRTSTIPQAGLEESLDRPKSQSRMD